MSIIQDWIDRKRRKELERVNREIEELKRRGPDYVSRERSMDMTRKDMIASSMKRSTFKMGYVAALLAVLVIFLFFYYHNRVSTLQGNFDDKEKEAQDFHNKLAFALSQLNQTTNQLEQKAAAEANLSTQYTTMQGDISTLKKIIRDMNETISTQLDDIADLNHQMQNKQLRIDAFEACISNSSISNKMDCL